MLTTRFWDRVDTSAGPASCWPWTGPKQTGGGYGFFTINRGKVIYAHRRSLELTLGRPLGHGLVAMHSCDNPPCCNPAHLREGTKADNSLDMARKGRQRSRLTAADVVAIRQDLAAGDILRVVAVRFGVALTTIEAIKAGRNWRHVGAAT